VLSLVAGILAGVMHYSGYLAAGKYAEQIIGYDVVVSGIISSDPRVQEKESSITLEQVSINYSTNTAKSQAYLKLSGTK
jgi:hypothetical protein